MPFCKAVRQNMACYYAGNHLLKNRYGICCGELRENGQLVCSFFEKRAKGIEERGSKGETEKGVPLKVSPFENYTFAAVRRSATASVFSQVNSGSSRPKWP